MSTTPSSPTPFDPALVAASGTAAAALIQATNPALAAASSADPTASTAATSGVPIVTGAPLIPPESRYADVGVAIRVEADPSVEGGAAREVVYLRRRFVPQPERLATAGWERVEPGDRTDLVAHRAIGDAAAFWQLCDANGLFDAAETEVPGTILRVALPEGFPGGL